MPLLKTLKKRLVNNGNDSDNKSDLAMSCRGWDRVDCVTPYQKRVCPMPV